MINNEYYCTNCGKLETWKPILGFIDYAISDCGRVKRVTNKWRTNTYAGKILCAWQDKKGYQWVTLYLDKNPYRHSIHSLVAKAFLSFDEKRTQVNHKDLCKYNNCNLNLEYATNSENMRHAIRHGVKIGIAAWDKETRMQFSRIGNEAQWR